MVFWNYWIVNTWIIIKYNYYLRCKCYSASESLLLALHVLVISITPVLNQISILSIHVIRTSVFQTSKWGTNITPSLLSSSSTSGIFPISLGFSLGHAPVQVRGEDSAHVAARDLQLGRSSVFIYKISLFPGIVPPWTMLLPRTKYRAQYTQLQQVRQLNSLFRLHSFSCKFRRREAWLSWTGDRETP